MEQQIEQAVVLTIKMKCCRTCGLDLPETKFALQKHFKRNGEIRQYRRTQCRLCRRRNLKAAGRCTACGYPKQPDQPCGQCVERGQNKLTRAEFLALCAAKRAAHVERILAARPIAKQNLWNTWEAPYGFKRANGELVPCPREQVTIDRIRVLRREGKELRQIAAILNEEGHRNRKGGLKLFSTVFKMLKNCCADVLAEQRAEKEARRVGKEKKLKARRLAAARNAFNARKPEIVSRIETLSWEGKPVFVIADILNKEGFKTVLGSNFAHYSIRNLIHNERLLVNDEVVYQPLGTEKVRVWAMPDIPTLLPAVKNIDPSRYYITSGDAVLKTQKLIDDIRETMDETYAELLGKCKAFLAQLVAARGKRRWLEVSRDNYSVQRLRAVDPRTASRFHQIAINEMLEDRANGPELKPTVMSDEITIYLEHDLDAPFTIKDEDGQPINLTGTTAQLIIKDGETPIAQFSSPEDIDFTNPVDGKLLAHVRASKSQLLKADKKYSYELHISIGEITGVPASGVVSVI